MQKNEICTIRKQHQALISGRISGFEETYKKGDKEIFRELCFCILTANTSARGGMKAIETLGGLIFTGSEKQISNALHKCGYRFWRKRADYIVETRKSMKKHCNLQIKCKIESMRHNENELRYFFAENAKGIGMKEASHFLRNIGFKNYAILDKHIVNCLHEAKVFETNEKPKNRKQYLEMENKMNDYSKKVRVPMAELDLILWCSKTGEVLK
ncbi:MAG TPA: N-glycosylase/DNA lyase [Nanoarchaeota archaeon]|nr:N-glycosylase/DNA lyase [Nanoarchaeota archaeon]